MGGNWEHKSLGSFKWKSGYWRGEVKVPAFAAFSFGAEKAGKLRAIYPLTIEDREGNSAPDAKLVEIAMRILENPGATVALVAAGLWEDFNGRGGETGMWWHGDLKRIKEFAGKDVDVAGADDVPKLLELVGIGVQPARKFTPAAAHLSFRAAFEEEHGVSVLTDGKKMRGTGYMEEAQVYRVK